MTKTALADYESKYCTLSVRNFMSKFASPTVFSLITVTNLQLHPEADTQFVLVTGSDTCILAQESVWDCIPAQYGHNNQLIILKDSG